MKSTLISCAIVLTLLAPIHADNSIALKVLGVQPSTKLKISGGGEDRMGNFGIGGGLEYSRRVANRWALGAEFDWLDRSELQSRSLFTNALTAISGDTKALLMVARLIIVPSKRFEPYIASGLGFGVTRVRMTIAPAAGYVWSNTNTNETVTVIDSSEASVIWALRLGFEARLTDRFSIGSEAGIFTTGETTHVATQSGRQVLGDFNIKGSQLDTAIGLNLIYHFGQN